jgi:hypothetical protein
MKHYPSSLYTIPMAAVLAFALDASAADQTVATKSSDFFTKPNWLTDLSLGVKEGYDDNLLFVADKTPGLEAKSSWITTVSPKVGFNFAPLLGNQNTLSTLSLSYTPDFALYHDASQESNNAHRIGNSIKGKTGDFSFSGDNAFLFVDGSKQAPLYGPSNEDGARSCYATAVPRERREQIQDRSTLVFQYDLDKFFIRPTASLLYYDLMTDWHKNNVAPYVGYQNYADRADVNGGSDIGYKVTPDIAVTLGYRYGHQYQQAFTPAVDATYHSSSDYQRILLGVEGTTLSWLNVKVLGGPDFRTYNDTAPLDDKNYNTYYGEALLTATISKNQTVSFTYKQWQWVSSTGKLPYFESTYILNYHINATKHWGFDITGKYLESDYTSASAPESGTSYLRDDIQYTAGAGVTYTFNKHLSANVAYAYDLGRNNEDAAAVAATVPYRQFDHQVVSLGVQYKF